MNFRRLLCTSSRPPFNPTTPPVAAAEITSGLSQVEAAGRNSDPPPATQGPPNWYDYRPPINPADDPEMYVYYKGYNFARENCMNGTFNKGGTTEDDVEKFVSKIVPNITGTEISETKKKEITTKAVRYALGQFGILPPEN